MKVRKSLSVVLACAVIALPAFADQSAAPVAQVAVLATKGRLLKGAEGGRLGTVYRVMPDGSAQLIIDGKLVTVPASSLSIVNGELTTKLTRAQVIALP